MCGKCGSEFTEDANFNWSCRMHQYAYSGYQWWCCGRKSQQALGCKFGKHEEKRDASDDQELDRLIGVRKELFCHCCKQKGHLTA